MNKKQKYWDDINPQIIPNITIHINTKMCSYIVGYTLFVTQNAFSWCGVITLAILFDLPLQYTLRWRHDSVIASQITSLTIVYSSVYSDADQRKHQSSASLAFVREIHRGPVNSPHKWPVTRKMFSFDDVIMSSSHEMYTYGFGVLCFLVVVWSVLIATYDTSINIICFKVASPLLGYHQITIVLVK